MEIVIVGAGPVGCYTAQLLKKYGFKTRIIEEHREVGKPVSCAGLVGRQVFENTLLPLSESSIINQINGALVCYRDDNFQINREGVAHVIDREKFDKNLSQGLEVECGKKLIEINKEGSGYILKTEVEDIYTDLVVGADGANSRVRKYINFVDNGYANDKKKGYIKYYLGVQYRIKVEENLLCSKITQVHLREGIPFFIWVIPEGNNVFRVGVISENAREDLIGFLRDFKIKGEIIGKLAGIIPVGLTKNYYKNIALVGDAAVQVKPLTGGGIYYGLKSAELLAECIRDNRLDEYDRRLKKKYGREIKFGLKARKLYEEVNEKELKNIFMLFKKNAGIIERAANFENHSAIFIEILKNPKIFRDARHILSRNIGKLLF
ncbi:MAG: NAD(P)/FAD-dependent oxidoreductase [Actinobacteria bacterium]|nr:NAD(P)/FAD-dependent oxidoreductase [Candidatus Atribacteria bacterium]MBE3113102.1 NAD(P)/FAD-dependent oxidoreductase [Actinomycetota bacterium]MBE3127717.1 NAD(P)/FAD-dependent oxidoreductase [Candidatus Atribacteria bacterium]